jgi:glutamate formiminotransferase
MGVALEVPECAQVSMNLLDFSVTPLWLVWETVRSEAAGDGVELLESELIGLCPLAALLAVADHIGFDAAAPVEERCAAAAAELRLPDFSPMQVLELRLAAAQRGDG